MPKPAKTRQVTLYLPLALARQVQAEGIRRRRKMGPAVLEILIEFFEEQRARKGEEQFEEQTAPTGEVAEG